MRLLKSTSIVSPECDHRLRLPDGRWLSYADYGDPQGRPILSFHGGLSCRLDIRFASEFCKEEGIRVISIDRPGVGDSDHHPDRQVLDWPDDVSHLALELGLSRFAVLGWSAGGPFALACAYRIPELITNVGTIGCMAPVHGRPETVRESGLRLDRVLFPLVRRSPWIAGQFLKAANRLPPWVLKRNMIREVVSKADRALIASLKAADLFDFYYEALRRGPWGTVRDYAILGGPWGFSLSDITKEVHLWQGEEDRIIPPCQAHYLADHIPSARLHLIPKQGHFLLRSCLSDIFTVLAENPVPSDPILFNSHLSVSCEGR